MCFESIFKGLPCAKVDRVCSEDGLLLVFCPFAGGSAEFEVGQGRHDSFIFEWVDVSVEVVVVGKAGPEGIRFG